MHPGAGDNAFPRIDAAFLTSISTNYAGSGRVSLTPDDYFQGIELTLTFQDIRISTSEDINQQCLIQVFLKQHTPFIQTE